MRDGSGGRLHRVLGGVGEALVTVGVLILAFVAYQLWGTGFYEARHQRSLLQSFESGARLTGESSPGASTPSPSTGEPGDAPVIRGPSGTTTSTSRPATGDGRSTNDGVIGVLRIPELGLERAVLDDVTPTHLRRGPGHYPGTALPGQRGNVAIAGHRTTYGAPFNRLDELEPGDPISVSTRDGEYVYKVTGWRIVAPTAVDVLDATPDDRLTLTTCHPKFSDRQRLVLVAALDHGPAFQRPTGPARPDAGPTGGGVDRPAGGPTSLPDSLGQASLGQDGGSRRMVVVWGVATAVVGGSWRWSIRRRRHWARFLWGLPPFLVVLVLFYANLELLLPTNF